MKKEDIFYPSLTYTWACMGATHPCTHSNTHMHTVSHTNTYTLTSLFPFLDISFLLAKKYIIMSLEQVKSHFKPSGIWNLPAI